MKCNRILQIGNLTDGAGRNNPQRRRLYSPYGIAPTVYGYQGGGNLQPLVLIEYDV